MAHINTEEKLRQRGVHIGAAPAGPQPDPGPAPRQATISEFFGVHGEDDE